MCQLLLSEKEHLETFFDLAVPGVSYIRTKQVKTIDTTQTIARHGMQAETLPWTFSKLIILQNKLWHCIENVTLSIE